MTEVKNELALSQRKTQILLLSVERYISSGQPVSSAELTTPDGINISSASVRNELASLEELGFLKKLHTSGGRVPTTRGYQAYISSLARNLPHDEKVLEEIRARFTERSSTLSKLLGDVATAVSSITSYPTIVLINGLKNFIIENIQIVPLLSNQAMALIETNAGMLDPIMIKCDALLNQSTCLDASICFTTAFKNKRIADLIENVEPITEQMKTDLSRYKEIFESVVVLLKKYIQDNEQNYISAGTKNILNMPEYQNVSRAKNLIEFIEDKSKIKKILEDGGACDPPGEVSYKFGIDAGGEEAAMVETGCSMGGINLARVAVIGPERMNYEKIASALKFISAEFENWGGGNALAEKEGEKH